VVVVTSRSGQKHRDEAHALGARDYLTKPFNQQVLGQMLRKWAPGRSRG
jgi:CheY-like chemotaxis protein